MRKNKNVLKAGAVAILLLVGIMVGVGVIDVAANEGGLASMAVAPLALGFLVDGKTLKDLQEKCKSAQGDLKTIKKQMEAAAAKGEDGTDEFETAKRAYESKSAELKALTDQLETMVSEAKEQKRMKGLMSDADDLSETQVPDGLKGIGLAGGEEPGIEDESQPKTKAKAIDHEKRLQDMENVFVKFMGYGAKDNGTTLSDEEYKLLTPNNKDLIKRNGDGDVSAVVPPSMYAKMLRAKLDTKAIPMMSSDGSDSGGRSYLYWGEDHDTLEYLPPTNPSLFDRVRKVPVTGGELRIPKGDQDSSEYMGVAVTRYDEGDTPDSTEANFGQKTIKCYPLGAYTSISNIMLKRDRVGIERLVTGLFGQALRNRLDYEIIHGTGDTGSQCLGIRQDDDVTSVARATANQISYTDLINLEYTLPDRVLDNFAPSYAISRTGLKYLKTQTISSDGTTDRRPLFSANTSSGLLDRVNTYPYFRGKNLSALGTAGDVIFGVWEHYWLGIEMEAVVTRSIHAKFLEGSTVYRIDTLAAGKPLFSEAFATLSDASGS